MKWLKFFPLLLVPAIGACESEPAPTAFENVLKHGPPAGVQKNSGPQDAEQKGVRQEDFDNLERESEKDE